MAKKQVDKYKPRQDGRYFTQISTGKYADDGKPIRIPLYAKSSKELEKLVADTKYEIEHGSFAHDKGITFGEYAKKWLEIYKATKSDNTKSMYNNILKNHIDYLEHKKLKEITKSDIQMQINKSSHYPRTCQQMRMTFSQIFESAIGDSLIIKNPCHKIELPKRMKKEKRALTDIEKKALKIADFNEMEKAFIYTLYGCGLRPAELYALTRKDINIKDSEININKALSFNGVTPKVKYPKTDNGIRVVQAPNFVIKALKDWMNINHNLILFCDENGEYRSRSGYYNVFNEIVRKMKNSVEKKEDGNIHEVKIEGLSQYIFRHNYCTELYYSGISLKEAQRLMGHSDYSMIMSVYTHLDKEKENTKDKISKICL